MKNIGFQLRVPAETRKRFLKLQSRCTYCGGDANSPIKCHGCAKQIRHSASSYSVGHHCSTCNISNGKGE